jgi:hypothetical protein
VGRVPAFSHLLPRVDGTLCSGAGRVLPYAPNLLLRTPCYPFTSDPRSVGRLAPLIGGIRGSTVSAPYRRSLHHGPGRALPLFTTRSAQAVPLFPCTGTADQQDSPGLTPGQQVVRLQTRVSYQTYVGDNAINVQAVSTAAVGCLLSLISRIGQTSHSNNGDTSTPHAIGILLAHPGRDRRRFKRHCHRRTP